MHHKTIKRSLEVFEGKKIHLLYEQKQKKTKQKKNISTWKKKN